MERAYENGELSGDVDVMSAAITVPECKKTG